MSTRGTVFVAINGMQAGVTDPAEAKSVILGHIGELVETLAQAAPVDLLEQLSQTYGICFEVKSGRVANVTFC